MSFPADSLLPILRQMHDAADHQARAEILLACPVRILMKYRRAFERACESAGFRPGADYLGAVAAALDATRRHGLIGTQALAAATAVLLATAQGRGADA